MFVLHCGWTSGPSIVSPFLWPLRGDVKGITLMNRFLLCPTHWRPPSHFRQFLSLRKQLGRHIQSWMNLRCHTGAFSGDCLARVERWSGHLPFLGWGENWRLVGARVHLIAPFRWNSWNSDRWWWNSWYHTWNMLCIAGFLWGVLEMGHPQNHRFQYQRWSNFGCPLWLSHVQQIDFLPEMQQTLGAGEMLKVWMCFRDLCAKLSRRSIVISDLDHAKTIPKMSGCYCGWLRNPAPVDRWFIPWFIGFQHVSTILFGGLSDFFLPPYYNFAKRWAAAIPEVGGSCR